MERHESHDLDGVIDEVARAMTSVELSRDLRPAVSPRLAVAPSWTFGWRLGVAAAGVAAVALVPVLMRPGSDPRPVPSSSVAIRPDAVSAPREMPPRVAPAPTDVMAAVPKPQPRVVMRQTTDDRPPTDEAVAIVPLAIEPIEADPLALSQVQIAPIDLEPVSIGELELVE